MSHSIFVFLMLFMLYVQCLTSFLPSTTYLLAWLWNLQIRVWHSNFFWLHLKLLHWTLPGVSLASVLSIKLDGGARVYAHYIVVKEGYIVIHAESDML